MCTINVYGSVDITIGGQSYGLTCDWGKDVNCNGPFGTYTVYILNGVLGVCAPGNEEACGLNNVNQPYRQHTQVFCDPCINRCNKDGNVLKYQGNQKWLFTTYVNASPNPTPIIVDTFTASIDEGDIRFKNLQLSVADKTCCCWEGEILDTYLEPKQVSLESLIASSAQPYITTGGDPSEACNCGCPGFCGPLVNGCGSVGEIISLLREIESQNCGTGSSIYQF